MRKIQLDFAAPSMRRALYRIQPLALAGVVVGAMLCAGAAWSGYRALQQSRAADARQMRALQASHPAMPASAMRKVVIPEAQARAVNGAIMQLNLPWRELQQAVAGSVPPGIALLALEPDPRKQVLKITAEAKNADDMIAYIEQLKQQEFFAGAALARHEIVDTDPNRPLRFQAEVQWGTP